MRMGKVMVMLVRDRCMCVGGRRGVKVLKNNGNNWWQETIHTFQRKKGKRNHKIQLVVYYQCCVLIG